MQQKESTARRAVALQEQERGLHSRNALLHLQRFHCFEEEDALLGQERSLLLQKVVTLLQENVLFLQECTEQLFHELLEKQNVVGELSLALWQPASVSFKTQPDRSRVREAKCFEWNAPSRFLQREPQPEKEVLREEKNETWRQKNDSCLSADHLSQEKDLSTTATAQRDLRNAVPQRST